MCLVIELDVFVAADDLEAKLNPQSNEWQQGWDDLILATAAIASVRAAEKIAGKAAKALNCRVRLRKVVSCSFSALGVCFHSHN